MQENDYNLPQTRESHHLAPYKKFTCRYCKINFKARGRRLRVCEKTDCSPERIKIMQEAKIKALKTRGLL